MIDLGDTFVCLQLLQALPLTPSFGLGSKALVLMKGVKVQVVSGLDVGVTATFVLNVRCIGALILLDVKKPYVQYAILLGSIFDGLWLKLFIVRYVFDSLFDYYDILRLCLVQVPSTPSAKLFTLVLSNESSKIQLYSECAQISGALVILRYVLKPVGLTGLKF